jgi:hypothetical protein
MILVKVALLVMTIGFIVEWRITDMLKEQLQTADVVLNAQITALKSARTQLQNCGVPTN